MMAAQIFVICAGYAAVVSRGTHPAPEGEASPGCHSGVRHVGRAGGLMEYGPAIFPISVPIVSFSNGQTFHPRREVL